MIEVLKVSAKSNCTRVAGALCAVIRKQEKEAKQETVELMTIGAGALNQAIKAIAIARGIMIPSGIDLICRPAFLDLQVEGNKRTAIRLMIEPPNE